MLIKLTDTLLATRKPVGREVLRDKKLSGLLARHGPRGWQLAYQGPVQVQQDGTKVRQWESLGPWSPVKGFGLTVAEARVKVAELQGEPRTVAARPAETLRSVASKWLAVAYPKNLRRRAKVEALLRVHVYPTLGGLPIAAVTKVQVMDVVAASAEQRRLDDNPGARRGGPTVAKALIDTLQMLFRYAEKKEFITEGRDPTRLLEPGDFGLRAMPPRDRALSAEELAQLYAHPDVDLAGLLAGRPPPDDGLERLSISTRAAIILGPLLAVRPSAMLGMKWDEVDLKAREWTVLGGRGAKLPHHLQPRAKPFTVPLCTTAVEVLDALRTHWKPETKSAFVLATPDASSGHLGLDTYGQALTRLTKPGGRVGFAAVYHPHDARRTWASEAERLGIEDVVIEKTLQHSPGKIRRTYRTDPLLERRRQAMELVDEHWRAVREGRQAKVVRLRK